MLWLIQRDFLEGTTVQQMVKAALEPVDNPNRDADIEEVSCLGCHFVLCQSLDCLKGSCSNNLKYTHIFPLTPVKSQVDHQFGIQQVREISCRSTGSGCLSRQSPRIARLLD